MDQSVRRLRKPGDAGGRLRQGRSRCHCRERGDAVGAADLKGGCRIGARLPRGDGDGLLRKHGDGAPRRDGGRLLRKVDDVSPWRECDGLLRKDGAGLLWRECDGLLRKDGAGLLRKDGDEPAARSLEDSVEGRKSKRGCPALLLRAVTGADARENPEAQVERPEGMREALNRYGC